MKALRQLGFLKLNMRPGPLEEDHRVLQLFRNRAELKKAYGGLQEETFRLKDLVKQQEGATQRVQEMLNALEGRLGDPATAYSALVFYQLRRLWQSGRELLAQFVADLAQQQEERERRVHLAQHNRSLFARRQAAEQQLQGADAAHQEAHGAVQQLSAERGRLTRFWHYFKRRALERRIAGAEARLSETTTGLAQAQQLLGEIAATAIPEFPGLSVTARRAINLAAIAYAEVLCLRVAELKAPLVDLAHQATSQREARDDYGSPQDCVLLMGQISRAQKLLAERAGLSEEIRVRHSRLQQVARYRTANDASPLTDSIALAEGDVLEHAALGADVKRLPNVLAQDTWDLFRVLLR
ncbi:MAG: hypothetical protein JO341_05765 [Gammaproteobacteria bacterium]|nr:hypothetical protein [Gammaproteobacteria bacterium]MBV9620512.1 hypothetical protein [Gammaproteobacteria bacterium]